MGKQVGGFDAFRPGVEHIEFAEYRLLHIPGPEKAKPRRHIQAYRRHEKKCSQPEPVETDPFGVNCKCETCKERVHGARCPVSGMSAIGVGRSPSPAGSRPGCWTRSPVSGTGRTGTGTSRMITGAAVAGRTWLAWGRRLPPRPSIQSLPLADLPGIQQQFAVPLAVLADGLAVAGLVSLPYPEGGGRAIAYHALSGHGGWLQHGG